jgi:putative ABC transport system permease protein
VVHWEDADVQAVQAEGPDCEYAIPELEQNDVRTHSNYNNAAFLVTGSYPEFGYIRSLNVGGGRFYNWDDQKEGRRVAFVGSDAAKQLFPEGRNPLGENLYLNDIPYLVIGVMASKKQDSSYDGWDVNKVFVPFAAMRRDFRISLGDRAPSISYWLRQSRYSSMKRARRRCGALGKMHNYDPTDKKRVRYGHGAECKSFAQMTDRMKYFLGAVGFVTLFWAGSGDERDDGRGARRISSGVRKALGPRPAIMKQFFIEAMIIALFSGAVGMSIAYGLCWLVNLLPMPDFFAGLVPTWQSGVLACGMLGAIAVLSALFPARRAASVDPIEALRFEAGG